MAGMILGMILIKATAGWQVAAWAAFLLLTWLHVYANIKALRCLHMTSLNRPRLHIVLAHFWHEVANLLGPPKPWFLQRCLSATYAKNSAAWGARFFGRTSGPNTSRWVTLHWSL